MSSMTVTQNYYVRDPMDNLLISVTLRKISGENSRDSVPIGRTWKYCFTWQEKKLSLSEKKREQERVKDVGVLHSNQTRKDREVSDEDSNDILSSYVDKDDFVPRERGKDPPTTSNDGLTHLTPLDLMRRPYNKQNESTNQHRAWLRANREDKFRAMHLVALIEGVERVLCSMRFYKESGLFCATPGFSAPMVDPETDPDMLTKGPKLTSYHLNTPSGSLYEYVIDNTHDLLPSIFSEDQKISRDLRFNEGKRDMLEVTRWQQPNKFPKPSGSSTVYRTLILSLEIVAVDNPQTSDSICVDFELELPLKRENVQWKLVVPENCDHFRATTPFSRPRPSVHPNSLSSASFGYHQQYSFKLVKADSFLAAEDLPPPSAENDFYNHVIAPVLHLRIYSRDVWGRKRTEGHGEINLQGVSGFYDFDVPIRKPITSIRSQLEELFLGIDESDVVESNDNDNREVDVSISPISTMITSRLGLKSESTGSRVRIRCNIIDLLPSMPSGKLDTVRFNDTLSPAINRVVKRSVQEMLQSIKRERRIACVTDPRIQAALRSLPLGDEAPLL